MKRIWLNFEHKRQAYYIDECEIFGWPYRQLYKRLTSYWAVND